MKIKLWIWILPVFLLFGCNFGCTVETAAAGSIATSITAALQCANNQQVLTDVTSLLSKTGICSMNVVRGPKGGPIAAVICPVLAGLATSELANQVPASWGCNPALAQQGLAVALTAACNLIPF